MNNFTFHNPTKLIFGKGCVQSLKEELPKGSHILMTYGGGSIKTNGIYDEVLSELSEYEVTEFGGIEANPDAATLDKAIAIGKAVGADFVLAVGGGSVIDGSKLIAAAIPEGCTAWEVIGRRRKSEPLPLGVVLTVPATGSEMNGAAVISNRATKEKLSFYTRSPRFSILDPSYTYTLSRHQVACGIADVFMHTMEQYMTYPGQSGLMDRMAEGVLLNLVDLAKRRMVRDDDYDVACEYMLTATFGLNGFLSMGVEEDWSTHKIGHELTALTGVTHGASLMMVYPSVLRVLSEEKGDKLLQYGERVWSIDPNSGSKDEVIERVIDRTEEFIHSLGLATSLKEAGVDRQVTNEIVRRFEKRGWKLGERKQVTPDVVRRILDDSLESQHDRTERDGVKGK